MNVPASETVATLRAAFGRLGAAGTHPRGQRLSLGLDGRPADGAGLVAVGAGHRADLQPAAPAAGQRRGRTLAGHRAAVGGPPAVVLGRGAAAVPRCELLVGEVGRITFSCVHTLLYEPAQARVQAF